MGRVETPSRERNDVTANTPAEVNNKWNKQSVDGPLTSPHPASLYPSPSDPPSNLPSSSSDADQKPSTHASTCERGDRGPTDCGRIVL
jgi:hypothetical protein